MACQVMCRVQFAMYILCKFIYLQKLQFTNHKSSIGIFPITRHLVSELFRADEYWRRYAYIYVCRRNKSNVMNEWNSVFTMNLYPLNLYDTISIDDLQSTFPQMLLIQFNELIGLFYYRLFLYNFCFVFLCSFSFNLFPIDEWIQ